MNKCVVIISVLITSTNAFGNYSEDGLSCGKQDDACGWVQVSIPGQEEERRGFLPNEDDVMELNESEYNQFLEKVCEKFGIYLTSATGEFNDNTTIFPSIKEEKKPKSANDNLREQGPIDR